MSQRSTNNTSKTFLELIDLYASNTRERERERESNNTKNIATNVAAFVVPKIDILKRKKLVIW